MTFIISWHCGLGGNFLADTLRYLSWPALSRSWHLAASGMGLGVTSTPIHARAWKEKALAGYNSQQLPTNNNIHMLIIIISLRWKDFVIISYLYKIPRINEPYNQRKKGHKTNTYRYYHSLTSPTDGSQLSFILSLKNCIMRKSIVEHCGICINLSVFISQ